ncbi:hypothetical protein SAMN05421741_11727 [Paenimyroides ummariense]|uniref:Membrane protein involved in the export of O-antigen and teichoic acid n=1 Tax=Paenimyroides ummariense TaxID=913024 RepID=A0A1I5DTQ6_9FLAO|nr:hypothetical protein SAMN05421741_11727 [Paenimyroides ummariense]
MFKNFLKLFSGNAFAQAIQLLGLLVLTTLYIPDDFGVLGKIQSISAILTIVLTLQLQHIIPLSKNEKEATLQTSLVFSTLLIMFTLIITISFFISKEYIFATLFAFLLAIVNLLNNFLIYRGEFTSLSLIFILRAIFIVILQLLFFYVKVDYGLLLGAFIGELVSVLFIFLYKKLFFITFFYKNSLKSVKSLVVEWRSYTIFGTIQELLSVLIYSLPVIFYVDKFGENIGGQFSMAYRLIWAPTVLVSSSLAQVLTHKFAKDNDFVFLKSVFWFDKRLIVVLVLLFMGLFYIDFINQNYLANKWAITFQLFPYMFVNAVFFLFANPYRVALRIKKLNIVILIIEVFTILSIVAMFYFMNVDVILFTFAITCLSVVQNIMIVGGYYLNKNHFVNSVI